MKKLLLVLIMVLSLSLVLLACGGNTDNSDSDGTTEPTTAPTTDSGTKDSSSTDSSTTDSGTTDSSTTDSDTTDSSTTDSSTTDSSTTDSSTTDSSTTDSSTTDSSTKPDPQPDPEDPDKNIPDGPITIAQNGVSNYVVVYDDSDTRVTEFAQKFVDYMAKTHKITLTSVGDSVGTDSQYCIYIGHVINTKRVRDKLNGVNDFAACVSGNDYVIYATNSRLYEYLYEILTTKVLTSIRNGSWETRPAKNFIYHSSDYADISYIDYVIEKNGGKLTQEVLNMFFEDRTYVAEDGTVLKYRLYVPYDYDVNKEYPFVTFLHGAGERGNDNLGNMRHMPLNWFSLENSPFWDVIVMAPQCPDGNKWVDTDWEQGGYRMDDVPISNELTAVVEIIDLVEETFPTDLDRYYVSGLSMGGFGTWDMIMRFPERFAAAVPLCGGADYKQAYKLVDMPIYTIHHKKDSTVPFHGTKEMVVALEILGSTSLIYEEMTEKIDHYHNVWDYASKKAEIWEWLFSQSKADR